MKELKNLNCILTGASRGIGVYIARALAEKGMNLALVARSRAPLAELAKELARTGVQIVVLPTDVARADALAELVRAAEAELGPIDVLVNNAALETNGAFKDFTNTELEQMVHVDLVAPMLLTRLLLPGMLTRQHGHVVNIASLAGKSATPYNVPYSAAKGGLVAFTHSLRAELRGTGVSASVVCPGFVSDAGMFAAKKRDHGAVEPKLLGTSTPEEVARAVVRAIESDVLEILVNPGPMRLMQAVNQLFPEVGGWLVNRMGVREMFRKVAESERQSAARPANGK